MAPDPAGELRHTVLDMHSDLSDIVTNKQVSSLKNLENKDASKRTAMKLSDTDITIIVVMIPLRVMVGAVMAPNSDVPF